MLRLTSKVSSKFQCRFKIIYIHCVTLVFIYLFIYSNVD